jgi:formamidopyrimidine-DNA glycosylase
MPELPDVVAYVEALHDHVVGHRLEHVTLHSPFVLRSVDPPLEAYRHLLVADVRRIGKRIVLGFDAPPDREPDAGLFLVVHLMIAGRLRWRRPGEALRIGKKLLLAAFAFDHGLLLFTEAGSKKRASLVAVRGTAALAALDPGGLDPIPSALPAFREALVRESHTLKRALTDPRLFSGIGNAYSDEILHAARLSPLRLTRSLDDAEIGRLHDAARHTLLGWIARLRSDRRGGFPEKVTAFRPEMAVHGRYGQPCPVCGSPVQRIVYADNECNYCATCQTGGRRLADRALSRLLGEDFPRDL